MPGGTIVWFRQDLRLADHAPLLAAVSRGEPVFPVYLWAPDEEGAWPPGGATQWWLHYSLIDLDAALRRLGSRLIVRRGPLAEQLHTLARETEATALYWGRRYEPVAVARDAELKRSLRSTGIEATSFCTALMHEPWEVATKQGQPFQVFTPFWKACLARGEPDQPRPAPGQLARPTRWPKSETVESLELLPKIPWDTGLRAHWTPGEAGAWQRLDAFVGDRVERYPNERDQPALDGVSRLSPHLHFGELSPRQVWQAVLSRMDGHDPRRAGAMQGYLRQLVWREFAHHLLYHFPHTDEQPLRDKFRHFPWNEQAEARRRWERGETGYPLVDAGMRELWTTGWMHNRVRMVVASFLVKDLLLPWQAGARWFWDTLVDADLANNSLGWQWTAGCGADAAPYFRIFHPVLQSEKFDPDGIYLRRWLPELSRLELPWLHKPWEAPREVLDQAGIELGRDYPRPIVDHAAARERALAALASLPTSP